VKTFTSALASLRSARHGGRLGPHTAKMTVAAVLSFVVAERLGTSAEPVLAPLTALLVVQLTMYETVTHGLQRVASVLVGVLVAVGLAMFVGLTWWSLGAVVAVSIMVGKLLRLGAHLLEVPISAMLVLAVGGAEEVAAGRVYETLIGAAVGIAVNAVVPPLYVQPAGAALGDLARHMSKFLRGLADELRAGWSRAAADRWLAGARALGSEVADADEGLARAERSARLNPRGGRAREAQPRLRTALTGLEHCHVTIRSLCRAMLDRTYFLPGEEESRAYGEEVRLALADVLDAAADAMAGVVPVAAPTGSLEAARAEVEALLSELHRRRDRLSGLLLVDPHTDEGAWQQHGALLAAVDRMRVEVEAAVRQPDHEWRPQRISVRQRQAVRRMIEARPGRSRAHRDPQAAERRRRAAERRRRAAQLRKRATERRRRAVQRLRLARR
jgi:Aromatic acid exporter family member 1